MIKIPLPFVVTFVGFEFWIDEDEVFLFMPWCGVDSQPVVDREIGATLATEAVEVIPLEEEYVKLSLPKHSIKKEKVVLSGTSE